MRRRFGEAITGFSQGKILKNFKSMKSPLSVTRLYMGRTSNEVPIVMIPDPSLPMHSRLEHHGCSPCGSIDRRDRVHHRTDGMVRLNPTTPGRHALPTGLNLSAT